MLKIKDNVDLKELEKFGFDYYETYDTYYLNWDDYSLGIRIKDRYIDVQGGSYDSDDIGTTNVLYDLIKADMVEKVEV